MASTLQELVNVWNESMPFPIKESDIKNPTESIFRRLLIQILKEFYVDTTCFELIDSENGAQARASRVKLVAVVNHFYKIANPGAKDEYSFCFMDLIQPGCKKTRNVLNYLMNYRTFVRHIYSETILETKEKMQEIDELRSKRNQLRKNIEEAKIKEEKNIKSIRDLDAKLPRQKKKIAELEVKHKSLTNEILKIESESQKSDVKLMEVKSELAEAESLVMSEHEIESILDAQKQVAKELEEQDQITSHGRQKLKETSSAIEEGIKITTKMEALYTSFSNIKAVDLKTKSMQLDELKIEVSRLKAEDMRNSAEIEETSRNIKFKEENLNEFAKKQSEIEKKYQLKNQAQKKEIKQLERTFNKLSCQESEVAAAHQKLRDHQVLTFEIAANALKLISTQTFSED